MYKRSRHQRYQRLSYRRRSAGYESALRHIEEARQLSSTLGGTDRTVKNYLFGLSGKELDAVLRDYGDKYGKTAKSYAIQTMPRWRSGRVAMSGMVAERFFNLLPPRMPLSTKYQIAEELWRYVGPRSSKTLRFGPDVTSQEVVRLAERHISTVLEEYKIPEALERRFDWLAANDVTVKQEILNHLQGLDKKLVSEAARLQADVMVQHLLEDQAKLTRRFTHTLSIGNHQLMLLADGRAQGCQLEEYKAVDSGSNRFSDSGSNRFSGSDYGWIWWVVGIGGIILVYLLLSR